MARGKGKTVSKNFSEILAGSDCEFLSLLEKSENGKSMEKLSAKEKGTFCSLFIQIFKKSCEDQKPESLKKINNLLELLFQITTNKNFDMETASEFINLLTVLNSDSFSPKDDSVVNNISLINEFWMTKKSEKIVPGMEYFTLKHLLQICSLDKPMVSAIQRLNSIRKYITSAPFDSAVPSLRPLLVKLVQSQAVLKSENGQRFIAQTLTLSSRLMMEVLQKKVEGYYIIGEIKTSVTGGMKMNNMRNMDVHKTILLELTSCLKKKASCYGKVYVGAWQNAKSEARTLLEKMCFKHIMEAFLKDHRTSIELTKLGQNLLSVLDVWHSERKKKNADFITMITDCYQSFIWKYLKSGFNVHRCNAADLFFKAFPLQRPGDNVMDAERLFNEQYAAMVSALRDDCHVVRIIAVREVCNILTHYWNSFTSTQIHTLLTIISKEDAQDASTADVRRMVYIGYQSFLSNPLSYEYVKQILPAMSDNIHDINQKVRMAFIQLLIAIKEKDDPSLKYSDLVPAFSLYYRLAEDNIKVGELIVKLLLSSYYQENMPVIEWTKRFIYLIKTYPMSYRNFFLYSEKVLPFSDAFTIMYEILGQLGNFVLSKAEMEDADTENEEEVQMKKAVRPKSKRPLTACNRTRNNEFLSADEKSKERECAFDDPLVVEGLFDIITILWILHDQNLNKTENQDLRSKIYEAYLKYAQPFINYYKDTSLFNSIVCLSGNIPSSLLRSNSITLPGYCMKMLKSNQMDSSRSGKESRLTMLVALIKWGKGSDVLEQVTLWLDAAFETQDLNATILPRRRVKISETIQPNSVVAIQILDTLMKTEYVKISILKKNYAQLFELWKFMSRIKKIIETRLEQGEPYENELVSDTFIKLCFKRYVKLIPLLKDQKSIEGEEEADREMCVNYQKEVEDLMSWAEDVLYPYLQRTDIEPEDIALVACIYMDILYVADNLIILHIVNRQFYSDITHLILRLLDTRHGLHFVRSGTRIAAVINYSGKLLFNVNDDNLKVFSRILPCIVSHILNVLTKKKLSADDVALVNLDLGELKAYLGKILDTYEDNFKLRTNSRETLRHLQVLVGVFLGAIIGRISLEFTPETRAFTRYKTIGQMPPIIPPLISLFYNKKFWTPMFIHVMNVTLSAKVFDLRGVLSCVTLLEFYAINDKKINKAVMKKAMSSASNLLATAKTELEERTDSESSVSGDAAEASAESQDEHLIRTLADEGLRVLSEMKNLLSQATEEDD